MFTKTFLKLFPPPKFLDIHYSGLDISDDAIRCVDFVDNQKHLSIHKYGFKPLPPNTIESGTIKNKEVLIKALTDFREEMGIYTVKVSLPEERIYLFKTEIFSTNEQEIKQSIEFKLEENVPLSVSEAIFFFDIIPSSLEDEDRRFASVSVAPRELVMSYLEVLKSAGLSAISFEVQAKACAHSLVEINSKGTVIIVNIMEHKSGVYIVCERTVCFTSTIPWGRKTMEDSKDLSSTIEELKRELTRVNSYWVLHGHGTIISKIILSGRGALFQGLVSDCSPDGKITAEIGRVWQNAFSVDKYIPPIHFEDSLDYAVASGLALPRSLT
jgi:Tfp pilus assembly PilM family ATPase